MLFGSNGDPPATSVCHIAAIYCPLNPGNYAGPAPFPCSQPYEKEGYIIQYLPEHCNQAGKVLDLITTLLPGLQIQNKPQPLKNTGITREIKATQAKKPVPSTKLLQKGATLPRAQQYDKQHSATLTRDKTQDTSSEKDRGPWLQFTIPFWLHSLPQVKYHYKQAHFRLSSTTTIPSNYRQYQWLQALWQLLQNTAWDRWRYLNGILYRQQDTTHMNLANTNKEPQLLTFSFWLLV